jgi:hypothetical protein
MTTLYKQGCFGELTREAHQARRKIDRLAYSKAEDVVITSIREGTHSPGSLHPQGDAFDMRPLKNGTIEEIKKAIGINYDVINEGDHWHVEYDKKVKA